MICFAAFKINLFCSGASSSQRQPRPQGMPRTPLLSRHGAEAAFQLVNAVTLTTHLSTDLSSDWQLPDSDSSGLMKASSIWQRKKRGKTIKPCTVALQAPVPADLCRVNKAPPKLADLHQPMPAPVEKRPDLTKALLPVEIHL